MYFCLLYFFGCKKGAEYLEDEHGTLMHKESVGTLLNSVLPPPNFLCRIFGPLILTRAYALIMKDNID